MIPKDVVSNLRICSGTYKSGEICKIDDLSKPLIINASLELSGLNVDLSGKRIRFNVSCGKEFIVKQSALQVWREGKLSIKTMNMFFSSKDQNVVVAECSITNELPKIKKAELILGEYSKTVDLENGKAFLKINQTELTLQGQNIDGKNVICEMQQKLENGDVIHRYTATSRTAVDFKYPPTSLRIEPGTNAVLEKDTYYFKKGVQANICWVTDGNPAPVLTLEEETTSSTGGEKWTALKSSTTGKLFMNVTMTKTRKFRCNVENSSVPERTVTLEPFSLSKPTIKFDTNNISTNAAESAVRHTLECKAETNRNIQYKIRYRYMEESDEGEKTLKSTSGDFVGVLNIDKNMSVYCVAYIDDERFGALGSKELKSKKQVLSAVSPQRGDEKRSLSKGDEGQMDNLTTIGVIVLIFGGIFILGGLMAYRQYKESTREQSAIPAEEQSLRRSEGAILARRDGEDNFRSQD